LTTPTPASSALRGRALVPQASILLIVAAIAWVYVVPRTGTGGGTMGMALPAFIGMWTLMMSAMMFPATAPLASVYVRTITSNRTLRIASFAAGYIAVWASAGVPAFAIAGTIDGTVRHHPGWAKGVAFVAYAACGVYQLTPLKNVCLRHCRSPIGHLLRFGTFTGPLRDARAGISHGAWCLACCWALMVVLFALGVMNLVAMVVLAAIITAEKLVPWPVAFSRVVGVVAIGLAIASLWVQALAPALRTSPMGSMHM
jgi:predicted metal-binding membrane protein